MKEHVCTQPTEYNFVKFNFFRKFNQTSKHGLGTLLTFDEKWVNVSIADIFLFQCFTNLIPYNAEKR
jgi:hypothetical protein